VAALHLRKTKRKGQCRGGKTGEKRGTISQGGPDKSKLRYSGQIGRGRLSSMWIWGEKRGGDSIRKEVRKTDGGKEGEVDDFLLRTSV